MKSYYEISLIQFITIVIFASSVKIQRTFFLYLAITNDREITKKKKNRNQVRTPMISKRLFFVETKVYKSSKD